MEMKCPRCGKTLTEKEKETSICHECGCLFVVSDPKTGKTKRYSSIITDSRKSKYKSSIRLFVFLLILWSIICLVGAFSIVFTIKNSLMWISLLLLIAIYIFVFGLIQFCINLIRDVYVLKAKVEELEKEKGE